MANDKDLLGQPMTSDEAELLSLYHKLRELSQRDDMAPTALANVKQAMVLLWNACNDLCLVDEDPGCD